MREAEESRAWSLGQEGPLEKDMATHSSILAWRIPWTEEPGGLQSTRSQGIGRDCAHACSTLTNHPMSPAPAQIFFFFLSWGSKNRLLTHARGWFSLAWEEFGLLCSQCPQYLCSLLLIKSLPSEKALYLENLSQPTLRPWHLILITALMLAGHRNLRAKGQRASFPVSSAIK